MNMQFYLGWVVLLLVAAGCRTESHFMTNADERRMVERDFEVKKQILANAPEDVFAVFNAPLSLQEREALQFLYAYSPLIDLVDGGGEFLLANVRQSLKVREDMAWGKDIPEAIFRHFVLPVRGSNESLDSSRMVFYRELAGRVKHCRTMEEAALEVNHWCHEKAIYKPTNARTCSPLAMMSTAYGRCGEESVFALAALRSVGIPARQVYTPRWAHCDDNHAWIEVWVDGQWKYLGACEPEPRLDIAWFTAPVRRGVLVQARVFGKYRSDEDVVSENANGTVVNVTANYTDVKRMTVKAVDTSGRAVPGAKVEFRVYNYGEYYPVASFVADSRGEACLTGGLGDWIVWASSGGKYGFAKLETSLDDSAVIVLDKAGRMDYRVDYELIPPVEKEYEALASDRERALNDRRFMYEDSVRNAYIASFPDETAIRKLAGELKVDPVLFGRLVKGSRGNHAQVVRFVRETPEERRAAALDLLAVVQEKDLQDVSAEVLKSHLDGAWEFRDSPRFPQYLLAGSRYEDLYKEYILNPRVKNELITAWRESLKEWLVLKKVVSVEDLLREMEHIAVVDSVNTLNIATSPKGVLAAMVTDTRSKELFFVAACRTLGVAARLNPVDGKTEYHSGTVWENVAFSSQEAGRPKGELMVDYRGTEVKDPVYYTHFTVSKLNNGMPVSLDLGRNDQVDMGGGVSYSRIFAHPVLLEEGDYILTTGNRRGDGSVMSQMKSFTVKAGECVKVDMAIRDAAQPLTVLGRINPQVIYIPENEADPGRVVFPGQGYTAIALVAANKEPTNHLIRDMSALKVEFEEKGVPVYFLFPDRAQFEQFSRHDFRPLPSVMRIGYDQDALVAKMLTDRLALKNPGSLPWIVLANSKGEVVFISQGYRIGLGTQILRVMND